VVGVLGTDEADPCEQVLNLSVHPFQLPQRGEFRGEDFPFCPAGDEYLVAEDHHCMGEVDRFHGLRRRDGYQAVAVLYLVVREAEVLGAEEEGDLVILRQVNELGGQFPGVEVRPPRPAQPGGGSYDVIETGKGIAQVVETAHAVHHVGGPVGGHPEDIFPVRRRRAHDDELLDPHVFRTTRYGTDVTWVFRFVQDDGDVFFPDSDRHRSVALGLEIC